MPQHDENDDKKSTYILDGESTAEMARLARQDRLITQGMGGLFPERADISGIERILDIGCGPGGWALEVAFNHPSVQVVGIDISQIMIQYAQTHAALQGLENASFRVMNALQPFDFPNESFDLVNGRGFALWMPPRAWPGFIQECLRVLRPGGVLRITDYETSTINTPAFERIMFMLYQALNRVGQGLSPNGYNNCLTAMLARFLRDANCKQVQTRAYAVDFSAGTEANQSFYHNMVANMKGAEPFFLKCGVTTQEEFDDLFQRMQAEILSDVFCSLWFVLTAWAEKP
jgi:ubiquinone/menaquinone biosynthesis C-methylase UbiE